MNEINELIEDLKNGDKEAFSALYSIFESSLINHLYHMLGSHEKAEEIFQESMLKMIRKIDYYEHRPELKNSFKSWLFRLATNTAIDEIRKNKMNAFEIKEDDAIYFDPHEEINTSKRINELISGLPSVQKTFLNLKLNEDLSHLEIATICGCHINTVKQGLFRARKSLKDLLIKEGIVL